MLFANRAIAGRQLAHKLIRYADRPDVVVLGVPRGGVPVAFQIAEELESPLDVFVVRKIGMPGHEEVAVGAIAPGGIVVVNETLAARAGLSRAIVEVLASRERQELVRTERLYRGTRPVTSVEGRIAILVDDGLATGASMAAAIRGVRRMMPRRVIVAVPVAPPGTLDYIALNADEVVCVATPEPFNAVSIWYDHFDPTSDDEVCRLLQMSTEREYELVAN